MSVTVRTHRQRFARYALRALLVFVPLIAVWGGFHSQRAYRERRVVAALEPYRADFGATHPPAHDVWSGMAFFYRKLVTAVWGEKFITLARLTDHPSAPLVPQAFQALSELPSLNSLYIDSRSSEENLDRQFFIDDGMLSPILNERRLRFLYVFRCDLSAADFDRIEKQTQLTGLTLHRTNLTEEKLKQLIILPRLRGIDFERCPLTGDALADSAGSPTLLYVMCAGTRVGKGFATFLSRSPNVREIKADADSVDNEFVKALGAHPSLKSLSLGSAATDDCIPDLLRMPSLEFVVFHPNTITKSGQQKLKAARPELTITEGGDST